MKTYIVAILSLLVVVGLVTPCVQADPVITATDQVVARMFSGTIEGIDALQRLVIIRTEEEGQGIVRFLAVTDGTVMMGLTKGDRVLVELDEHGVAKKIVSTASDAKDALNPKN